MLNCFRPNLKVLFTALGIGISIPLSAGLNVDFSTWLIKDQNAFRNYEAISDFIVEPTAAVSYIRSWKNSRIRAFYEGGYTHFQEYDQRIFHTHYGGLALHHGFGESGFTVAAGFQAGQRANRDSVYTYYNYNHQIAYLNIRRLWQSRGITLAGAWMQQRYYRQIPQFDFRELRIFLQQNLFFPTRTTVIGRIQFEIKRFLASTVDERLVQTMVIRMDNPGSGQSDRSRNQGRGNGRGETGNRNTGTVSSADTAVEILERVVRVETPGREVMQLKCSLRVAQSVSATTGLAVEGRIQRRVQGSGRLLSYQDSGYEDDDPLADDPYNFESQTLVVEWSQRLFWGMLLRTGWQSEWKDYAYLALNLEGEPLQERPVRKDARSLVWFMLTRQFVLGGRTSAEIFLSCHLIDNESNEAYSDYQNQIFTLGWRVGI